MNRLFLIFSLSAFTVIFSACDRDSNDATLRLFITDAPIDEEGVIAAYITITSVEYQLDEGPWREFRSFDGPKKVNLLALQNGESELLGDLNAAAGEYTGLRFMLDAVQRNEINISNAGCYLEYEDGTIQPLFVPSGAQSGYKGIGTFSVPLNGNVSVTADFDLRKSVVRAGASGIVLLRPVIRLIVNDQAGEIRGRVSPLAEDKDYVVYAYQAGTYSSSEAGNPGAGSPRFPKAISNAKVLENGEYILAFLAPGDYDLVTTSVEEGEFKEVVKISEGVSVSSGQSAERNIAL